MSTPAAALAVRNRSSAAAAGSCGKSENGSESRSGSGISEHSNAAIIRGVWPCESTASGSTSLSRSALRMLVSHRKRTAAHKEGSTLWSQNGVVATNGSALKHARTFMRSFASKDIRSGGGLCRRGARGVLGMAEGRGGV
eukprot:CAMPEP_0172685984 /NCGR_PEP_ID=MMETSP1074-20121228/20616_1 /TAXON_ID=2916 /ORGANISM="Ceratium fusus, Strain PA161109" /LENGTH=139 /DNA_ID=CAMNT_0013505227 /DNA_START=584 /DNA_END=1003 /DNA_ORIENTATION=+